MAHIVGWKPRHAVGDSTWRKFIRGRHISEEKRDAILEEVADGCIRGLFREVRTHEGQIIPLETLVAEARRLLVLHASWWDDLCDRLRSLIPVESTDLINMAVLRLAVVELAVRGSAFCLLNAVRPESLGEPERIDVQQFLLPMLLRQVLKNAGISRQRLADELSVTKEAVDQWLARDAVIPTERVDDIAGVLAREVGKEPVQLGFVLRLMRGLTQVLMGVRNRVDSEEPNHMINALVRLTRVSLVALEQWVAPLGDLERKALLMNLMALGSSFSPGPMLRQAMLEREQDDSWRGVISTSMDQWDDFLTKTLVSEKGFLDMRRAVTSEGFKYLMADEERARMSRMIRVLVPPERLPSFFVPGAVVTPERLLEIAGGLFHHYRSDEAGPDGWRMLMELAEFSRFHIASAETELQRVRWEVLSWFSYATGLQRLTMEWSKVDARDDAHEMLTWLKCIPEVRRSLPLLPEKVDPRVQPTVDLLRVQLGLFECLEQMSENLEVKIALEALSKELESLQATLLQKEEAGLEVEPQDQQAVLRLKETAASLEEKSQVVRSENRARKAKMASLLKQLRVSLGKDSPQPAPNEGEDLHG